MPPPDGLASLPVKGPRGAGKAAKDSGTLSPTDPTRRSGHKAGAGHLLDVHAIKSFSSYHTKPLPEDPRLLLSVFWRTVFLPLFPQWWMGATPDPPPTALSRPIYAAACAVYLAHAGLCALHFMDRLPACPTFNVQWDVYLPIGLLILCSVGHGEVVACSSGVSTYRDPHDAESSSESEEEDLPETDSHGELGFAGALQGHRVNCSVWGPQGERRKRLLTLPQLRHCLEEKMARAEPNPLYQRFAIVASAAIPLVPLLYTVFRILAQEIEPPDAPTCFWEFAWTEALPSLQDVAAQGVATLWASDARCAPLQLVSWGATAALTLPLFRQLAAAEMTFSRRVTYARCFKALTSSQKAQRLGLPHFSLKTTENIKVWLALRGGRPWLARHPHQRAADVVGTSTFVVTILLLGLMLYQYFVSSAGRFPFTLLHWEVLVWSLCLSVYLLRFLVCGTQINAKYAGISILLTEQINVHLRIMENTENGTMTKPKMQKLHVSNNVLKLSTKLLRELGKPTRISGFAMNPTLYNVVWVVLLSALSACLSDMLGFNLRLWTLTKMR